MFQVTVSYYVELMLGVSSTGPLEDIIDPLMDAFDDISGVEDVDLGIDAAKHELTISMYISAESQAEALSQAHTAARTAVHATGGHTPGWEDAVKVRDDDFDSSVRRADLAGC